MNRIFITGDKHFPAEYKYLSFKHWPLGRELDKDDYLIILGDFGICQDNSAEENWWLDWFEDKPWTTLWIDGNHQNFPLLYSYPIENWNNGQTHILRPHLRHLCRGEIFYLNNKTFFTMGGAASIDKIYRKEGKSWWPQEIPSREEFEHAAKNLEYANFNVDIILSHTAPNSMINRIDRFYPQYDDVTNFLDKFIISQVNYKDWFCGHFHIDKSFSNEHFHFLYNDIIEYIPNTGIMVRRS